MPTKKKKRSQEDEEVEEEEDDEPDLETLSEAIRLDQEQAERYNKTSASQTSHVSNKKRIKQNRYFSDEEDFSD